MMPKCLKDKQRCRVRKPMAVETRKEKNKHAAAKSRANKKALMSQMSMTISSLQEEVKRLTERLKLYEHCAPANENTQETVLSFTADDIFDMGYIDSV